MGAEAEPGGHLLCQGITCLLIGQSTSQELGSSPTQTLPVPFSFSPFFIL